jgi:hypothetical protein
VIFALSLDNNFGPGQVLASTPALQLISHDIRPTSHVLADTSFDSVKQTSLSSVSSADCVKDKAAAQVRGKSSRLLLACMSFAPLS